MCPLVDKALIEHLDRVFAARVHPNYDLREYDRQAGAREVITYLKQAAEQAMAR